MIMHAIITGNKVECLYVEPREGTIEVELPNDWKDYELSYDNGIVIGEKIDNEYKPIQ